MLASPTVSLADVLGTSRDDPLRKATLAVLSTVDRTRKLALLSPEALDFDAFLDFAERNRIAPIAAHGLLEACGHDAHTARAREIHERSKRRMTVLLDELDLVAARLSRDGIRLVALKNAGIARGIFPCPACCPMGDMDTLVERERFRDAHRIVLECGFSLDTRAPDVEPADLEHGWQSGGTEYRKVVGNEEVWLELQWRAVAGRFYRHHHEPAGSKLVARSVPILGTEVRLLKPEDNLLQVCMHTAKHSYVRAPGLRLHTDVDRIATHTPPVWSELLGQANALAVTTTTYFSLALSHALLDARIPADVLAALAPPLWKIQLVSHWLRRVDVFEPSQQKFGRAEFLAFHALLYDTPTHLLASALDTDPEQVVNVRAFPGHLKRGIRRLRDVLVRYQR